MAPSFISQPIFGEHTRDLLSAFKPVRVLGIDFHEVFEHTTEQRERIIGLTEPSRHLVNEIA
jgi:hypothetical protein